MVFVYFIFTDVECLNEFSQLYTSRKYKCRVDLFFCDGLFFFYGTDKTLHRRIFTRKKGVTNKIETVTQQLITTNIV